MGIGKSLNYERTVGGVKTRVEIYADQVLERVRKKRNRVLYKTGAYTRTSIQRSMRYRKKASQPGSPPSAHKDTKRGPLLRKLTKFAVDELAGSAIAGPEQTPGGGGFKPVPQVLNEGGKVTKRLLEKTIFNVGDIGPIRNNGTGRFARTYLETDAQAARASRLSQEENEVRSLLNQSTSVKGYIAARPFTKPAFTDGGKRFEELIEKESL